MGWQREQFAVPRKAEQGLNQDESEKKLDEKKNVEERCREEKVREKHAGVSGKMFNHSKKQNLCVPRRTWHSHWPIANQTHFRQGIKFLPVTS